MAATASNTSSTASASSRRTRRPNHPTTCGKVERFHQTLKRWLTAHPAPATIDELQALCDRFVDEYNQRRPHRSLADRTPAAAYQARPKAAPAGSHQTHYRVRHDRVSHGNVSLRVGGVLHHIGLGRHLHGTPIIMLINDLDVRVIHATTGEIIRQLTIDPDPPLPRHRTTDRRTTTTLRTPKNETSRTLNAGSAVRCLATSHERTAGFEPATLTLARWRLPSTASAEVRQAGSAPSVRPPIP